MPRDDCTYYVDTDVFEVGLGAVLSQDQGNGEVVVAYASIALSKAERNYDVTRRELLGAVYALKTFKQYVLGRRFVLRTDHAALQWLRRTPEPLGQQARWLTYIEMFDFTVVHRAGTKHGNADGLSRRPYDQQNDSTAVRAVVSALSLDADEFLPREAAAADAVVGNLIDLSVDAAASRSDEKTPVKQLSGFAYDDNQMADLQHKDPDLGPILE